MSAHLREEPKLDGFASGRLALVSIGVPSPPPFHTDRPRLFEILDRRGRITLVSGPAGFGKTTLVSGWLQQSATVDNVAWIAADESEDDPHLLAAQWLEAIRSVSPDACEVAYSMLHDARAADVQLVYTSLLNDLGRQAGRWTLVLDDYPPADPRLDAVVSVMGDRLPANVDLVILARGEPALPVGRWRVTRKLTEIGLADLRFTADETRAFMADAMQVRLADESLALLDRRVEGWAAGIQLAALWLGHRHGDGPGGAAGLDMVSFDGRHRFVADYLANEILAGQDDATRRFLVATSVVGRFTAGLCDALTGAADSREILEDLRRRALFVVALDDRKEWYRYHHLFRDFLRSHVDPAEVARLHARASLWFEEVGQTGDAVRHALAAGDPQRAAEIVRANVEAQLAGGHFHRLLRWLDLLPDEVVHRDPELSGHKAWLHYMRGQLGKAEAYSRLVAANDDEGGTPSGPMLAFKAFLAINRGRIAEAERLAAAAAESLADTRTFFSSLAVLLLGVAQRISGDRVGAISTLRSAMRLAEQHGNPMVRLEATSDLVRLMTASGRLREAVALCQTAIDEAGHAPSGLTTTGPLHIRLGQLLYELDDLVEAGDVLERGVELCDRLGNINYVYLGKRHLARLAYARGNPQRAYDLLAEASCVADRAEHARQRSLLDVVAAEFRLREGNVAAAAALVGVSTDWAERTTEFEQVVYARLLLAQDRPRMADAVLLRMEASARREDRIGGLFTCLLLRVLAAEGRGQRQTADDLLIEALSLGAPAGYVRSLLDLGGAILDVLARVEGRSTLAARYAGRRDRDAMANGGGKIVCGTGPLTGAESSILHLLVQGMTNRDIAARLDITVGTAKWHIHHIYQKLDVASRTAAVYRAREMQLIRD